MRRWVAWAGGLMVAAANGCGPAPLPPPGSYSDVALIADGGERGEWAALVKDAFEQPEDFFVGSEPRFRVAVVPAEQAGDTPDAKNVVVCGVMDARTPVGRRVAELLDAAARRRVEHGELNFVLRKDHPLRGQVTLVVTAPGAAALRECVRRRGAEMAALIEASCRERLRANLLRDRRADLTVAWEQRLGFHLDVPSLYEPYGDTAESVELHRESPPRVLGIFRSGATRPASLAHPDELFALRSHVVGRHYQGDTMDRARTRFDATRLGTYPAVRMSGYWTNDRYSPAGGYYETYFVWNGARKQLWIVDLVVYAPGHEKTPCLRELRAVAETFRYL